MTLAHSLAGFNLISPFGSVTNYVPTIKHGFFTTAKSTDNSSGWGDPRTDNSGQPIEPGTGGGPNPVQYTTANTGRPPNTTVTWSPHYSPGSQLFGNITWRGPWYKLTGATPVKSKGRLKLSFHGPLSRIFPTENFSYGSDEAHNNIYYNGLCVAVAPRPVLGAAIKTINMPGRTKPVQFIVAACYDSPLNTVFYRIPFVPGKGVSLIGYTSDFRAAAMMVGDSNQPIYGQSVNGAEPSVIGGSWSRIGDHTGPVATQGTSAIVLPQRVPWFFDPLCVEAHQMKEVEITFDYCLDPTLPGDAKVIKQTGFNLYKATINDESVTVSDLGNSHTGYTMTVVHTLEWRANYSVSVKWPSSGSPVQAHVWTAKEFNGNITLTGSYDVAVDYIKGKLSIFKVNAQVYRSHTQWWYKGIDTTIFGPNYPNSNQGDTTGDTVGRNQNDILPGDGRTSIWLLVYDTISLQWTVQAAEGEPVANLEMNLVYRRDGTIEEYLGKPHNPDNNLLHYIWEQQSHIFNLDGDSLSGAVYVEERARERTTGNIYKKLNTDYMSHLAGRANVIPIMENMEDITQTAGDIGYGTGAGPPNTWADVFSNTLTYKLFDPYYSLVDMNNYPRMSGGKVITPNPPDFISGILTFGNWTKTVDLMSGPKAHKYTPGMGIDCTDDGRYAISLGYMSLFKPASGGTVLVQRYYNTFENPTAKIKDVLLPNEPPSVADGAGVEALQYWFYPLGAI